MVTIRIGKSSDADGIAALFREGIKRKNWIYTGTNIVTKHKIEGWRKQLSSKNPTSFSFIAEDNGKVIGSVGYTFSKPSRMEHRVALGWGIHPDYQQQGIATKLLEKALKHAKTKGFKRAEAEVAVHNISSVRLALKTGFVVEGIKRKALKADNGKYLDTYIVGKLL